MGMPAHVYIYTHGRKSGRKKTRYIGVYTHIYIIAKQYSSVCKENKDGSGQAGGLSLSLSAIPSGRYRGGKLPPPPEEKRARGRRRALTWRLRTRTNPASGFPSTPAADAATAAVRSRINTTYFPESALPSLSLSPSLVQLSLYYPRSHPREREHV